MKKGFLKGFCVATMLLLMGSYVQTNSIVSSEIDTYAELNAITADVTLTHNGLIDTYSELNTLVADKTLVNEEDAATFDSLVTLGGGLSVGASSELTIASGAVTITETHHWIDTQNDDASDTLTTLSGGAVGDIVILFPASDTRDVIVQHAGGGNMRLAGSANLTLDNDLDNITLLKYSTVWVEIARSEE